jgi:hypothetical protein
MPATEKSLADAVTLGYQSAIGRAPDAEELRDAVVFLEGQTASYTEEKKPNPKQLAMADFCQVLFGLNEFVYVE